MTFTPIEIIALIMVIAGAIKMIVLLVNPKAWMNLAKSVYSNPGLIRVVAFILAAVVLYYLLQEITIVQIFASVAFISLLILVGLARDIGSFIKKYEAQIKKNTLWKENWLYILVWIVLMVWVAKELFM